MGGTRGDAGHGDKDDDVALARRLQEEEDRSMALGVARRLEEADEASMRVRGLYTSRLEMLSPKRQTLLINQALHVQVYQSPHCLFPTLYE